MVAVRFAHCIGVSYWNGFVAHCMVYGLLEFIIPYLVVLDYLIIATLQFTLLLVLLQ